MPTPIPIIDASCGVKSGTFRKLANTKTSEMPMPIPNRAIMIGRPMASTDPNVTSRMRMAARKPIDSAPPGSSNSENTTALPPGSIASPGISASSARAFNSSMTSTGTGCWSRFSNRTVANAI
jgi:hypothetical protein